MSASFGNYLVLDSHFDFPLLVTVLTPPHSSESLAR